MPLRLNSLIPLVSLDQMLTSLPALTGTITRYTKLHDEAVPLFRL